MSCLPPSVSVLLTASLCALVVFFHLFIYLFFTFLSCFLQSFTFFLVLYKPLAPYVCVWCQKVAYRLSCESYMILKINHPVCSPPVTIGKPCTSPPLLVSVINWLCSSLAPQVFQWPPSPCRPDSGSATSVHPNKESTCIFMLFENKDIFERQMVLCE